jgi:methyl-CpG-binding domain protein 4
VEKIDLIQTHYLGDPWKIMISCILLNQTTNIQVRPVIINLFNRFPTPNSITKSDEFEIASIIRSTGFQNVKARRIIAFTQSWNSGERNPDKFPGIGPYGRDSWKIFIEGKTDFHPEDKKLSAYLLQLNS